QCDSNSHTLHSFPTRRSSDLRQHHDRPWSGADPPAAVYFYSPDRRAERPTSHLANFKGVLQVDGYPGFERLSDGGDIKLAACWRDRKSTRLNSSHQITSYAVF